MVQRFLDWLAQRHDSKRRLAEEWESASARDAAGLTDFQARCELALRAALSDSGFVLTDRRVDVVRGRHRDPTDLFVDLAVAQTPLKVWIYRDAAVAGGPGVDDRYEETWSQTPDELIATSCSGTLQRALGFRLKAA